MIGWSKSKYSKCLGLFEHHYWERDNEVVTSDLTFLLVATPKRFFGWPATPKTFRKDMKDVRSQLLSINSGLFYDEPSFQLSAKALHIAADRGEKEVAEVSVVVKNLVMFSMIYLCFRW